MTEVGDATAETTGAPEGAAESQAAPDLSPLLDRMNEFGSQLGEIREQVGSQRSPEFDQAAQQFAQPYGQQPVSPDGFQPQGQYEPAQAQVYFDEYGNPVQLPGGEPEIDPEQAREQLAQMLGLDSLQTEVAQMRAHRDAEALKSKYADFRDPEKMQSIQAEVQQAALELAGGDQQLATRLMDSPAHWERTYLAGQARQSAASETPAGSADAIQLETPGGTAPETPQRDEGDAIVDAYQRRQPVWNTA